VGPIHVPEGSTNCHPQVQKATTTEYLLVNPAKPSNFIIGELVSGGQLSFIVENLPKDGTGCPGTWLFKQLMEHFGSSVTAIQGNWVGPTSDNLQKVNQFTATGMTLEAAAEETGTGKRAKEWGYPQVEEVNHQGTPGNYARVHVLFKK
jgi:hypothetical protein